MAEQENNGACSSESCSGCAHADSCASKKVDMTVPANEYTHVKKVIGVISGKGGVGKSMVTASLARLMREQGYSVGILDADITGPSIPKMYGIHEHAMGTEVGMFPCIAKDETRIMSVNLLLDSEDTPVIWRGPVIAGVVKQFWNEVLWGDLDYLFVDMPPGTGDVPLPSFCLSTPLDVHATSYFAASDKIFSFSKRDICSVIFIFSLLFTRMYVLFLYYHTEQMFAIVTSNFLQF